jgi:hypothetical protein
MNTALSILIGIVVLALIIWLISEIQIRVWINAIERHLQNKFSKLKTKVDEEEK